MSQRWRRIARAQAGEQYAARYAERFRTIAAEGGDIHGEAVLVTSLVPAPARVLDAGCGTGRIAVRLAELGYDVVGCDIDESMVEVARADAPQMEWHVADLDGLDLGSRFDLVLLAGNVIPLLDPGTLAAAARSLASHLADDGVLITGFGLDADHLPGDCPATPLEDVDAAFADAGLMPSEKWSTWQRDQFVPTDGYVVAEYRRG